MEMTLATLVADYIERCFCGRRKFVMSVVVSIAVGLILLGLYVGFFGSVHVGSVVLGAVLYQVVRSAMCATDIGDDSDDERNG